MNIFLDQVSKRFGHVRALDQITLNIPSGQIICVLGPNGAGKTTLLRLLSSIVAPDHGRIFFDSELFNRGRIDLRRRLYFLPDFPLIFPNITVARQIATVIDLYGLSSAAISDSVATHLNQLDILHTIDTAVGNLSRGQIFKVALATLLTLDPELWLLDEPFASGMDPVGISYLKEQARLAAARGRTVLYTTQILDIAEKFSDRICLIHRGQVRVFDSIANLRELTANSDGVLEEVFRKIREERR
jgi:ABC-type multidrug transport system ATPase subunit